MCNRGPLKILNGIKLILDGQGNHLDSYTISLKSFRSFRGPLFRKRFRNFLFAVCYSKPALEHSIEEKLESEPETVHVILLPTHCTIAILGTMGQTTHTRLKVIHRSKTTTILQPNQRVVRRGTVAKMWGSLKMFVYV